MEREKDPKIWRTTVMSRIQQTDLSIAQVARRAGYVPDSVYHVLSGYAEPGNKMMMLIDNVLDKELNK